jgi:hypothetical protein
LASGTSQRLIPAQSNWNRSIAAGLVIQRLTWFPPAQVRRWCLDRHGGEAETTDW